MISAKPIHFLLLLTLLFSGVSFAQNIKIASPKDYKLIDESTIGTRDEGLGVANGHQVAEVSVTNMEGEAISLASLWKEQPLMVVFYRGGWCPYCNMQIKELADNFALFEEAGVMPVLISVDKPDVAATTTQTYDIPFPVLSDQDLLAHTEFNVINKLSDESIARAAERGRAFSDWSDREHQSIAVASSFLVDTKGVVQWSTVLEDYTSRPTKEQLLTAISHWKMGH